MAFGVLAQKFGFLKLVVKEQIIQIFFVRRQPTKHKPLHIRLTYYILDLSL